MGPPQAAFYCVCDSTYFLGAVGMLNSLRKLGHDEPVFVLDCGLTESQRNRLAGHASVVAPPDGSPPWLLKAAAPLHTDADVAILIDTDLLVTRPLTELIASAAEGRVVAFRNESDRFFSAWGDLPGLGEARPRPYVSSSLVFLGGATGRDVLSLMDGLRTGVDFGRTFWRANDPDYPFLLGDQDLLNAILATEIDPARVTELDPRLEAVPPFEGLKVIDEHALQCAFADGTEPYVVHHYVTKPWLEPTLPGVYTRLLVRLLCSHDVAIRVPAKGIPLHLRPGLRAKATRWLRGPVARRVRALRGRNAPRSEPSGG